MTKKVLLAISIAATFAFGMMIVPSFAGGGVIVVGGGDPPEIKRTRILGETDDTIKRAIISTKGLVPQGENKGWMGFGFFTDRQRMVDSAGQNLVLVVTKHGNNGEGIAFYDNMVQGRAPASSGAIAEIPSPANGGALKIKVLCDANDLNNNQCGNQYHPHYAWVGGISMDICASGVEVKSLSYSQPPYVNVLFNKIIISNIAKDPHQLINSLGNPAVDEFDDYSFTELTNPVAFGITGAVDTNGNPHACVNPI